MFQYAISALKFWCYRYRLALVSGCLMNVYCKYGAWLKSLLDKKRWLQMMKNIISLVVGTSCALTLITNAYVCQLKFKHYLTIVTELSLSIIVLITIPHLVLIVTTTNRVPFIPNWQYFQKYFRYFHPVAEKCVFNVKRCEKYDLFQLMNIKVLIFQFIELVVNDW